jgi:hypothetical protein
MADQQSFISYEGNQSINDMMAAQGGIGGNDQNRMANTIS